MCLSGTRRSSKFLFRRPNGVSRRRSISASDSGRCGIGKSERTSYPSFPVSRLRLVPVLALLLLIAPPPDGVLPAFPRARNGAAPLLVGVHAPNRAFNEQDYARVAEGELGAVKLMGYHPI